MKKKTEDTINVDIDKKQIQISWDCVKEMTDLYCRSYLQMFALFLAIGFSFLLAVLTEKLPIFIGIIFCLFFILDAIVCISKVKELISRLGSHHKYIIKKLCFV